MGNTQSERGRKRGQNCGKKILERSGRTEKWGESSVVGTLRDWRTEKGLGRIGTGKLLRKSRINQGGEEKSSQPLWAKK